MPADFSYDAKDIPEVVFELIPETENENEELETVAEPFASLAEETTEPVEAASASSQLADDVWDDQAFVPATEDDFAKAESVYPDPQDETIAFNYDAQPDLAASNESEESAPYGEWSSDVDSDPAIAMPVEELPSIELSPETGPGTFVELSEVLVAKAEPVDCPFCKNTNDAQAISCHSCMAVLTLSDLELLLANQDASKLVLRHAVEELERRHLRGQLESDELITLGLGHVNLRNLQRGYECLSEASKLSPNNVVLAGQVNALLIRLGEIKQQEEAHLKMPKGKSILVVDDSPTVRKLIAGKLEKCGHEVICANDGVEALEQLENFVPDLVLLDIAMPRMDGYQVCKHIRSNNATKDVTVVMISGKDGFFDKVRGRMAGTTGYITKPFGPETLMKTVEMYLSGEAPELDEV
jgi:twitching motility two-component system response regulator PilG